MQKSCCKGYDNSQSCLEKERYDLLGNFGQVPMRRPVLTRTLNTFLVAQMKFMINHGNCFQGTLQTNPSIAYFDLLQTGNRQVASKHSTNKLGRAFFMLGLHPSFYGSTARCPHFSAFWLVKNAGFQPVFLS